MKKNPFEAVRKVMTTPLGERQYFSLSALEAQGVGHIGRLPYSLKVLLEACLRHCDGHVVLPEAVQALASYDAKNVGKHQIPFNPSRVVLQDFTGVPAVVDLAAMRAAIVRMTGSPDAAQKVNPLVPCDLVIDHSVQVDAFGSFDALGINRRKEFERNLERYSFLKWGQKSFDNFRVVPPGTGIVHQVNLEYLAKVVWDDGKMLYPDSLVGTDSHTTMIDALGVVGWGVGGIEAEAVMLGQPIYMLIPEVVGFRLDGKLAEGCTATDLVLTVTQMLRAHGVVGKFVEFFGPGLDSMPLANRATIANMAPEYGATMGFFPVDAQTLRYLELSGRDHALIQTVEQYTKAQGLWRDDAAKIVYSDQLQLDMGSVEPSLAGPKRPQDRVALSDMKSAWSKALSEQPKSKMDAVQVTLGKDNFQLQNGAVVIAAITSCTNTSNPDVMLAAGLVARKAQQLGLQVKPWVKTSLAPGSQVVTEYLEQAELIKPLEALGFHTVGYGCTTCIGNSGPLPEPISAAIQSNDLVVCSVLSGNRNFEGRISPDVRANYLASPPLVVAYALAGSVEIDLQTEPLGTDTNGNDVFLRDIWPAQAEIDEMVQAFVHREQFLDKYAHVFEGSPEWNSIESGSKPLYEWQQDSTYVQEPPFFLDLSSDVSPITSIEGARCLAKFGDSVTTDHISPAGSIPADSPAGKFLLAAGVEARMFNSFGSRRGNDRIMSRGTFGNIRVRNQLAPGTEGGWTRHLDSDEIMPIYDAAMAYQQTNTPLVILAGIDYGMGSSRDWAAKGPMLLGVRAVIAKSFERIHRSNLIGMGIVPLIFQNGEDAESLALDGTEIFHISLDDTMLPRADVPVVATTRDGKKTEFTTTCRIDTPVEIDYYRNGGILHMVLRRMSAEASSAQG